MATLHMVAAGTAPPAGADATVYVYSPAAFPPPAAAGYAWAGSAVALVAVDKSAGGAGGVTAAAGAAGGRLVLAPSGPIGRDVDDVRRVAEAVVKGVKRAMAAGAVFPHVVVDAGFGAAFPRALPVAAAAALRAAYVPLSIRADRGEAAAETVPAIAFTWAGDVPAEELAAAGATARALEEGGRVTRDIGGGDPEAMAPGRAAEYIAAAFESTCVAVTVISDPAVIAAEFPLAHAVARASLAVPHHAPRIVRLEYAGAGPIERQVFFAGKGIVYDTGGVDVKTGGAMVGMSRDKVGAAVTAGFFKSLTVLAPPRLRAVAYLAFVRNSIGSDAYVADEIIKSHAGVRVLVMNTDAEGRMAMIDLLSHIRQEVTAVPAASRPPTVVHTVATLTGHAVLAYGPGYTIAVDNGPARAARVGASLAAAGEAWGDPVEAELLRREDFEFVAPKTAEYDVKQGNNLPSVATPRGHQFPAAVMAVASGLDKHGRDAADPIAYSHLDIAGSSVAAPFIDGVVTGQPIAALLAAYAAL